MLLHDRLHLISTTADLLRLMDDNPDAREIIVLGAGWTHVDALRRFLTTHASPDRAGQDFVQRGDQRVTFQSLRNRTLPRGHRFDLVVMYLDDEIITAFAYYPALLKIGPAA